MVKAILKNKGIRVVVSDRRVLNICYDKLEMNKFLDEIGVKHPKAYSSYSDFKFALDNNEICFPVVVKYYRLWGWL